MDFNGAITFSLWKFTIPLGEIRKVVMLQWGHNFFVMEISSGNGVLIMLQWGHNFFVMEISLPQSWQGQLVHCFNGAITFSLWKSVNP